MNYFSDFIEMVVANKSREQEIFRNQLLQWMKNDLRYRVAEKIKQKELRDFWDHLFTTEIRTLGEEICKYLITLLRKESGTEAYINFCESTSYGYGAILYGCILLQKKEFLYNTFCEAIILFVTWIQACNNTQKSQINWLEDRSFGNWIGVIDHVENHYVFSGDVGLNVVPMSKLELEMEGDLEFESILLEDTDADAKKEKFSTWFEKLFHENIEAIYGFQTLMYAFAGSDTEKLEDVWLHVQVDWSGNDGTGKGLVLNQLKKEIEEEEYIDTFMVRVSPWMSECTFGWMNFIQNSKTDQFLNPEDWLKTRIAQPIMGELEKRFRRKHADVDIPEDCFDIENINLKGISLALISEAYKTWLEENKDQEILPYDSPQVLYNIGKRLEALENLSFKSGNGMIISAEKYTLIKKELDRRYSSHANEWNYAKAFSTCPYIDVMSDMWTIDDHEKIFDKLFPMKES